MAGQSGRKPPGPRLAVILVDTSVWIDHLNNSPTGQVARLRELIPTTPLLVGDLILCEILQGLRSEREARLVERGLRRFATASLLDVNLAVPRRTIDFCAARELRSARRSISSSARFASSTGTSCCMTSATLNRWFASSVCGPSDAQRPTETLCPAEARQNCGCPTR